MIFLQHLPSNLERVTSQRHSHEPRRFRLRSIDPTVHSAPLHDVVLKSLSDVERELEDDGTYTRQQSDLLSTIQLMINLSNHTDREVN